MASKKREYGDYLKRMAAIEREKVNLDRRRIMNAEIAAKYPHYNGGSPEFQAQEKANYFKGRAVDRADWAQTLDEKRFKFSKVRHADDVALRGRRLDILSEKNLNDFKLGQGNINLGLDRLNFDQTAFFQELGFKRSAFARDLELKNRVQKATEYDRSWNPDSGLSDTGDPLKRSGTYMQGLEAYREGGTGGLSSQPLDTAIAMKLKSAGGDPAKAGLTEAELAYIRENNTGTLAPKGSAKKVVSPAASPRTISPRDPKVSQPSSTKPFGYDVIHSNLGHVFGVDKASHIATGLNRAGVATWNASTRLGNTMINRGIRPALKWAGTPYEDPYDRKNK